MSIVVSIGLFEEGIIDICPTVDWAFKLMPGSPEHTAKTKRFLFAVRQMGRNGAKAPTQFPGAKR